MNQAEGHAPPINNTAKKLYPLAFLKMNREKPLVVLDAEHFLDVFFNWE